MMRFPLIAEVQAYWEGLRAGRQLPLRSEVDPRGIERALEYAFVLERIAPQVARFRLAGMHLNDLMGMEVRGMPLTSFFLPQTRDRVGGIVEQVFQGPAIADLSLTAEGGPGKPALDARLLVLPLKSDLGDVSRALGCLISDGQIGRAPRRFDLAEARITTVEPGRPTQTARAGLPQRASGLAEAAAPFRAASAPAPHAGRSRAHLRLVKSED